MTPAAAPEADTKAGGTTGLAFLPLLLAIAITLVITLDPRLLADAEGRADHAAASALFWAMSAGYVRGVGFVPRHRLPRWLFSTAACLLALALAVWHLVP